MHRVLLGVTLLQSMATWAEPRVAVHPLELGNFSVAEGEALRAQFEVMVARMTGITLAGSARIDEALSKAAENRCEGRDPCLRFLAEATDSLYAVYVRLDSAASKVIATAQVMRSDGATVRNIRLEADSAKDALVRAVAVLRLEALEPTLPVVAVLIPELTPPPLPAPEPVVQPVVPTTAPVEVAKPDSNFKRVAGFSLVGAGGATLAVGGVFAGLAASNAAANRPDAAGRVSADRAAGAATALSQSNLAAILIPTGAAVAVAGAVLVWWPRSSERHRVQLGVAATGEGLVASASGEFP